MALKAYGSHPGDDDAGTVGHVLEAVHFVGSAEDFRVLAAFFRHAADGMAASDAFRHVHLQDFWADWIAGLPDVSVNREEGDGASRGPDVRG